MPISANDLAALSRLLDQAMELDASERGAWMAALPEADKHLAPMLHEMLAERNSERTSGFLSSMPELPPNGGNEEFATARELVGPYRLIREIGSGGMGTVWLAERADGNFKRQIALKLPRLAWGAGLAERMSREREIGALLEHPNIARLYDAGLDERGRPFLALEYIDGVLIDAWCKDQALSVRDRLKLIVQVARAVSYAHGRLVVHRDLKPSNVLVSADGQTHLLDFGIAKLLHEAAPGEVGLTEEQGRVLTPHFASPEQLRGEAITVQSDVYSLGVLTYELLTGRTPYKPTRKTLAALEEAILEGEPALASTRAADKPAAKALHGEIDTILAKALRREPNERYATADAFANDIERHLAGERVLAQPDSAWYRISKAVRRNRVGFSAAAAVVVTILVGAVAALLLARHANEEAMRANAEAEQSRVVKDFVVDVFKVNSRDDPAKNELRQLPAELLLQRGSQLIDVKFRGHPRMQAELYGMVSGIFADMGAQQLAAEHATKQLEALRAIGASADKLAMATLALAQALAEQDRLKEARAEATKALSLVSERDNARATEVRLVLAHILIREVDLDAADKPLIAAERVLQANPSLPAGMHIDALAQRARWLGWKNRLDDALPLYDKAIALSLSAEGPLSVRAIKYQLHLAQWFEYVGPAEKARPILAAALSAMRTARGADDVTAGLVEVDHIARLYGNKGISFEEARDVVERIVLGFESSPFRLPDIVLARTRFALGILYAQWGDFAKGYELMAAAMPSLRPATLSLNASYDLVAPLGEAATFTGHHAQADPLLRERLSFDSLVGRIGQPGSAFGFAALADNERMQGRFNEAERILDSAPSAEKLDVGQKLRSDYKDTIDLARAQLAVDRGQAARALELLTRGDSPARDISLSLTGPSLIRGIALCAVGRAPEGLALMTTAIDELTIGHYAHRPDLARLRSLAGLCALGAGDRGQASEMAKKARAAFVAQPGVSPYFKAPLLELDLRLAESSLAQRRHRVHPNGA